MERVVPTGTQFIEIDQDQWNELQTKNTIRVFVFKGRTPPTLNMAINVINGRNVLEEVEAKVSSISDVESDDRVLVISLIKS